MSDTEFNLAAALAISAVLFFPTLWFTKRKGLTDNETFSLGWLSAMAYGVICDLVLK
jgi:hypothetical protein